MGRSVSTARGAVEVLYFAMPDVDDIRASWAEYLREDGDPDATADDVDQGTVDQELEHVFDRLIEDLQEALTERYPSFTQEDAWSGREDHVIATNGMADVAVSEYMGLVAVSIAPTSERMSDLWRHEETLREGWTKRMAPHLARVIRESAGLQELSLMGRFSNGEAVYTTAA